VTPLAEQSNDDAVTAPTHATADVVAAAGYAPVVPAATPEHRICWMCGAPRDPASGLLSCRHGDR
jgi:hypothetical protein